VFLFLEIETSIFSERAKGGNGREKVEVVEKELTIIGLLVFPCKHILFTNTSLFCILTPP